MKMKPLLVSFALSFAAAASCLASDEQVLRDLDAQWAAAAAAKDLDKVVSFYSDDATVLPPPRRRGERPALVTARIAMQMRSLLTKFAM
jgi:ketosteroid isomerase-like protein